MGVAGLDVADEDGVVALHLGQRAGEALHADETVGDVGGLKGGGQRFVLVRRRPRR